MPDNEQVIFEMVVDGELFNYELGREGSSATIVLHNMSGQITDKRPTRKETVQCAMCGHAEERDVPVRLDRGTKVRVRISYLI